MQDAVADDPISVSDIAIAELRELAKSVDIEGAHVAADRVLCNMLRTLGYDAVAEAFEALPKWHA